MRIGITGGIGAGKTMVSKVLESRGYCVFNSDNIAKELILNDKSLQGEIISIFGDHAFLNGHYNRQYIAAVVFTDGHKKERLNQLIHPRVRALFDFESQKRTVIFNEAAILFETGAFKQFDKTILVTSPIAIRRKRILLRDALSEEEIEKRMTNQWSDEQKRLLADFEIVNDDQTSVLLQLEKVINDLAI